MIMAKEVPAAKAANKPERSGASGNSELTDQSELIDYSELIDKDLVELVRQQEQNSNAALAAYSVLIERYRGKIYGLVYNMTSNKEDTEDLVQEVFVKAYASMVKFRGQSSFYTWVYRIAVNRSINFLRKRKRRQTLSLNNPDMGVERREEYLELVANDSPFRDATLSELQQKLNEAINTLSEKHKSVVVMHDIQGISHEKIADILECSAGTVRSRLFYARQRLQAELSDLKP